MVSNVAPTEESKTTGEDEPDEREGHDRIIVVGGKGGKRLIFSHQVKSGITECGDGMENTVVKRLQHAHPRQKACKQQQCTKPLYKKRALNHTFDQPDHTANV